MFKTAVMLVCEYRGLGVWQSGCNISLLVCITGHLILFDWMVNNSIFLSYFHQLLDNLNVGHLPPDEKNPHVVRIGWSVDDSSLQLGESCLWSA